MRRPIHSKKNIEAIYPLSPLQEGLLFHTLYDPTSGLYLEQWTASIHGNLNIPAFKQAWQHIIDQHPILRTLFLWERRDKPLQVVRQEVKLPWTQQNWRGMSTNEQQQRLNDFLQTERAQGFELSQAPLMRLTLIHMDEDRYQFIWSFHHLLLDGWSVSLALKQLFAAYEALCHDQRPASQQSRPYKDFIIWLQQQDLSQAASFWREALKGFTAPTSLPINTSQPSSSHSMPRYAEQHLRLSSVTTTALQSLARQQQVTLNTVVQAAWALLLSRYSGEEDVVFGATTSGRPAALSGIEEMMGLFINTLPVRARISPQNLLPIWLKDFQAQQAEARQYEFSPLVQIQRWSEIPQGQALFETLLVFENYPANTPSWIQLKDITIDNIQFLEQTNYPLTLMVVPGTELWIQASYNCDHFSAEAITRLLGHWQTIMAGMVACPGAYLGDLPWLTSAEKRQILIEWNATKQDYSADQLVHQLFEAQAAQTPDKIAVIFEDEQLTYQELNHRANRLARYLQKLGIGPEVRVGIHIERSLEMMVGLLGILKAGGAYVPIDPAYPWERIAFMLADAKVPLLLTQKHLLRKLADSEAQPICLDTDWEIIERESQYNLTSGVVADNLAYVIYTSGSTGQPKGVQIPHGALSNFLEAMRQEPGLTSQDVLLAVTSLSFDIAALELFLPLIVGARIVLVSHDVSTDGSQLLQHLTDSRATVMQATPATWRMLIAAGWQGVSTLKILCGGEVLSRDLASQLLERGASLWNLYGPTETTIWSTLSKISTPDEIVTIGRPIANTQIYLLDKQLQPVPVGISGELYIGGAGLARGYLNQPELTSERFIPNPFLNLDEPGMVNDKSNLKIGHSSFIYKTGDLARYRPNGNIEYIGRVDNQVKIRGFRIELGEIETALRRHIAIREAVATVWSTEQHPDDKRLAAYFVTNQNPTPSSEDLRRFLKVQLPDHMIPSVFTRLEMIPLTPNGKVDRRTLPPPCPIQPELADLYVAPRNPAEQLLANIWAELLGVDRVGSDDNFFELGGHSLLATQVVFRVKEAFHVELPIRTFFENVTIARLADTIALIRRGDPTATTTKTINSNIEAILDPAIYSKATADAQVSEPRAIFLTGATGFLGAYLLSELLRQTQAEIYCLVRATDIETAQQRIQKHLETYLLWEPRFSSRIIPVLGDLTQPCLGISDRQFQNMANLIDLIYHNGALVNFVYPYYKLKPANVFGVQEMLRLATHTKAIPVHYISTVSVFDSLSYYDGRLIFENEVPSHNEDFLTGYAQSKWVAERLVMRAWDRHLPVTIFRPGVIVGDSQRGVWNTGDFLSRFLKGCIQLGYTPELDHLWRITPVDYVSKAIIHLSRQLTSPGKTFHILGPDEIHLEQLSRWLNDFGYELEQLPYQKWLARVLEAAGHTPTYTLSSLLPIFVERIKLSATEELSIFELFSQDKEPKFDCQNMIDGLAGAAITCPSVTNELFDTYLTHFIRSGFLEPPP
jgi:amino acid adenylation domain-containing protein/thioester reductase-like protein